MQRSRHTFGPVFLAAVTACSAMGRPGENAGALASAVVRTPDGSQIGVLRLESRTGGVRITGQLSGLPAGVHGMHFHETGRCDAPDYATAGAHFNPGAAKHGLVNPAGPHAGDLPAIGSDVNGRATVDATTALVTLSSAAPTGLFDADGSTIVVHAAPDDQHTDPSGNSGGRIACGVVERVPPG